jgi:sterol desaturase/sphingolipid hydroxylase (fatty acid hydroxylase superfamily)
MDFWLRTDIRIGYLVALLLLLLAVETFAPLYAFAVRRWRHALPNLLLTALVIAVNLLLAFLTVATVKWAEHRGVGLLQWIELPPLLGLLIGVLGLDLFAYFAHAVMHSSEVGWRLHQVHHTDDYVDVTTALRQHPCETLVRIAFQLAGIVVFGTPTLTVIIYLTISGLNAQLEHANVRLPQRWDQIFQLIWVTPNMHKAHHSRHRPETNSNYGNIFSIWDRLFGTYTPRVHWATLRYGLDEGEANSNESLLALLKSPFINPRAVNVRRPRSEAEA